MALKVHPSPVGNVAHVAISGKLSKQDYEIFAPLVESLIEKHGKIRILFEMSDFHGWDVGALWEDIKFDAKHHGEIERLGFVGDKLWEEWMAKICRPFTSAEIKYFDVSESSAAAAWIAS
jgi:hypothetical protein